MKDTGFLKLQRSQETGELIRDRNAFHLLVVIALRARYTTLASLDGLTFGQALVGDCTAFGMTRKEYRGAQRRLTARGLASFVGTPRGTIATLADARVFSLNDDRNQSKRGHLRGHPATEEKTTEGATGEAIEGPPEGQLGATNKKERRKEGKIPEVETPTLFPPALDTEPFKAAWAEWQAYASARRLRKWVPQTITAKLAELAALSEAEAIAAIRASIGNGWQSIYPAKGKAGGRQAPPSQYAGRF